jgi:soluble lytic murein transglycosylase-like protein
VWVWIFALAVGWFVENSASAALSSDDDFTRFDSLYKKFGKQFKVPWRWIKAIAIIESNQGNADSVAYGLENPGDVDGSTSSDGKSWGVMQTTLSTARWLEGQQITVPYLNIAENSIRLGTRYLQYLISVFGYDEEKVSRGYNGGPGYAKTALGPAMTTIYYAKFKVALETVLSRQPGDPLEY